MNQSFVIPFGVYKGMSIIEIPDTYLFWLADRGRSTYYKSKHSIDKSWQPDIRAWEESRKECDRRGAVKIGERWERK